MKDKTEGLMTMLLVAASCFFALLLCVEGQTVTHRQWIQLRGEQPWSALELEIPNTIQGHVVVNTAITFLGVNSTNPNPVILTAANSVLDQRRSKVAQGSSWTFNLSVGQDFAPVTLTDTFSPCAGDFLWNAKGFPFFYIVSFPSYPPPVWLDVQIQATVIDPSVKFDVPAQLPIRKNTYYTLTLPGNGADEEVFLQALPSAPTIMNVFTKLTFALGCGPNSVIVNVLLSDQNATQLTAVASQSWVDGSRGNEMLVTVTAHTIPATPDYTITFRPPNNDDGHELAWYWIFLLSITTALSISLVAVAIYFYHKRRRGSYETLGTQPSFVQRIRTLVNQPKDEQNIQENLRL